MPISHSGWRWLARFEGIELPGTRQISPAAQTPALFPLNSTRWKHVWAYLRANKLAISVFDNYEQIVDRCCEAWNFFANGSKTAKAVNHYQPMGQNGQRIRAVGITPYKRLVRRHAVCAQYRHRTAHRAAPLRRSRAPRFGCIRNTGALRCRAGHPAQHTAVAGLKVIAARVPHHGLSLISIRHQPGPAQAVSHREAQICFGIEQPGRRSAMTPWCPRFRAISASARNKARCAPPPGNRFRAARPCAQGCAARRGARVGVLVDQSANARGFTGVECRVAAPGRIVGTATAGCEDQNRRSGHKKISHEASFCRRSPPRVMPAAHPPGYAISTRPGPDPGPQPGLWLARGPGSRSGARATSIAPPHQLPPSALLHQGR